MDINELKDVAEGQSRSDCPSCGGRHTLAIVNESGEIKFNCHRLGCKNFGTIPVIPNPAQLKLRLAGKSEVPALNYEIPEYFILGAAKEKCFKLLLDFNCIKAYEAGLFKCGYDPKQDRLVVFITNEAGTITGAIGRRFTFDADSPKVLNYPGSEDAPFICGTGEILYLVEDVFSAIAVTRIKNITGLALLGTKIKLKYIPYMQKYKSIVIALDKDAKISALNLKALLTYYFPCVSVLFLDDDIKNMNDIKLNNFLKETMI